MIENDMKYRYQLTLRSTESYSDPLYELHIEFA